MFFTFEAKNELNNEYYLRIYEHSGDYIVVLCVMLRDSANINRQ